jgi:hypothetical protein
MAFWTPQMLSSILTNYVYIELLFSPAHFEVEGEDPDYILSSVYIPTGKANI